MNAPFGNIFVALQARIHSLVPGIAHIDQDMGQLKNELRPPVAWPCVLVDFEAFTFECLGGNVQSATGIVVLTLGFKPSSNTSQLTPGTYVQSALEYYEMEWQLQQALEGWSPGDDYGSLARVSALTQKRTSSLRVREIRYSIAFQDYSAKSTVEYVPAVGKVGV